MVLEEYFGKWMKVIDKKILINTLNKLAIEYQRKSICPVQNKVFRAFRLCPYEDLKIVMLGQDPYPQKEIATGILFGNNKDVPEESLSPSLQVIKEAAINFEIPHYCINFDQTLESWSKQGILMLNSALTVEMNKVGSHTMLWRPFISRVIKNISENNNAIIFVLFGEQAKTFKPYINQEAHYIITSYHPSYYVRTHTKMPSSFLQR